QLHAGLDQLPLPAGGAFEAHHRPLVAKANGALVIAKAGGDEAGDLRGDVGAQRDHLTRARLDEANGGRPGRVAETEGEHVLVLEGRGDDAREPPALEHPAQTFDDAAAQSRRIGRVVAHARGQAEGGNVSHLDRGPGGPVSTHFTALRTTPSLRKPTNTSASSIATFSCASR